MSTDSNSAESRLETLSQERARLLKLLLDRRGSASQRIQPYAGVADAGPFRAVTSWAQQRLWFIDQLEGGSAAYNIPVVVRLRGKLDENALRRALDALVQRHEALRTVFVGVEGEPMQEIAPDGRFQLRVMDLQGENLQQRDLQVHEQIRVESREPFDLCRGPLIRGRLLRIGAAAHVLLITIHHIVSDGWSMGIMLRELTQLYGAYVNGRDPMLPALPIQYADYARWQREWLRGEVLDRQLQYWRSQLKDAPPELELPTDKPRPAVQRYRGQIAPVLLDAQLTAQLNTYARQHEMTLFMVLYAGWAILMARLSNSDDIVIGTPVANRRRPELEGLIGFFVNTLVLRVDATASASLPDFLRQVKELTLAAYEHQDIPFEHLVETLHPERSLSRHPIFQVMFVLQNAPQSDLLLSELEVTLEDGLTETSKFDLLLSLMERGNEIVGSVNYDSELFEGATVKRWIECFQVLLHAMVSNENCSIAELPLLSPRERWLVIESSNATHADYPRAALIQELFEEQARLTPRAVAVMHHDRELTYAQLNAHANQLARYLRIKGVGPDQLVGICAERGVPMVIGVLAVLKAGGAYMPLDPSYPPERLEYMLRDAAPHVVLTQQGLREQLPDTDAHVVLLDAKLQGISADAIENLLAAELHLSSSNLAYVIYTSGSTGRPKGTAMPHRAMVNLLTWHRRQFGPEPVRVLQFAALSFDVAFQEIFSTLCNGGTLVLLDEWMRRDAGALTDLLNNYHVERLFIPPLMLQSLAEYCNNTGVVPRALADVITAGEQLRISPEIVKLFTQLDGCCRLHNHYGPTETHVVTALILTGSPGDWPPLPSIGSPIANSQIYILDAQCHPVPLGVVGEIYIAGENLARGYVNRPELTAERFVVDPYSAEAGARMYKTGDVGRRHANGTIEYQGRNDDQVKIRGFRIELGEIEAQLASHADVREAAVVTREDALRGKRLVAYVTCRDRRRPAVEELRGHLLGTLPAHMVPSAFVVLDCMPLTPSGKLDRRALPEPDMSAYPTLQFDMPQGQTEEVLAEIWQELLLVERIGRRDNFFELGGHSLLVLKALFRINRAFGCALRAADVYKTPILMELAAQIDGGVSGDCVVDLRHEAALDDDVVARVEAPNSPACRLLLTGATGFVGRFLLAQLIEDSNATIYCLVRAPQHEAQARLKEALSRWDLWRDGFDERVVAVAGNLREPGLGLGDPTYRTLADNVDSIYHCATSMNHLETYAMAKAANVDSTKHLLRLAMTGRPKMINYISTLGVFNALGSLGQASRTIDEDTPIDGEEHRSSQGYVASKWVSEKILMNAAARGFSCNIFRLGLIWADSRRGRYDELQRVYRIIKSCLLCGYGIQDYQFEMTPTPVDYAARAVVFLANRHSRGGVFHIASSQQTIGGVFERCNEVMGTSLKLVPLFDWIGEVKRLHDAGWSLPVVPLLESAFSVDKAALAEFRRRIETSGARFDSRRTQRELEHAGIRAPVLNDELLRVCLESMFTRDEELQEFLAGETTRLNAMGVPPLRFNRHIGSAS